MSRTKMVALPFLVPVLLPFDYFFTDYPCAGHNIGNILMKLHSNVYEIKMGCHIQKWLLSLS